MAYGRDLERGDRLVAEEQDAVEREMEPAAGIDRVELILCVLVAVHRYWLTPGVVSVLAHHSEREVADVDDQQRTDQVAVYGIASRSSASLDLDDYPQLVVDRVHPIRESRCALIPEQNWPVDLVLLLLPVLHGVAEQCEAGLQAREDAVAGESRDGQGVNGSLGFGYHSDELVNPRRGRVRLG